MRRRLDSDILMQKLFNYEVKMVAEHEIGFAEGRRKGREAGFIKGFAEGFAKGFVESFAEGKKEGHAEGVSEGELKKARKMAKSLKAQNVAMPIIVKSSGLSEEEINSL